MDRVKKYFFYFLTSKRRGIFEYYEIDLSALEPHIVGPHTPDLGREVSAMSSEVDEKGYSEKIRRNC